MKFPEDVLINDKKATLLKVSEEYYLFDAHSIYQTCHIICPTRIFNE
jgi:hypothetical protein